MPSKSIASLAGLLVLAAALAVAQTGIPPADPEQVLRAAGLARKDSSYVLAGELEAEAARQKAEAIHNGLAQREARYASLQSSYNSRASATGQGLEEYYHLKQLVDQMAADMLEAWRENSRYKDLVLRTQAEYASLARDAQVKAALRVLNKGRHPQVALGPAVAYERNVHSQAVELLKSLGYHVEGHVYWLEEEAELVKLGAEAARLWQEVAPAASGLPAPAHAGTPKPSSALLLAERRADLVELVHALRERVSAVQKRRDDRLAAGEARDAVIELNRIQGKTGQVSLGINPGLKAVLQNLDAMDRALPALEKVAKPAGPKPRAPILDPAPARTPAPADLSKLPHHRVLRIADGETIEVQKLPGVMRIRLLGVAAPANDSPLLRSKFLGDLLGGQIVALDYDPRGPLDKGRIVARVYRVSDGLFVNLKMVQEGYGATDASAPQPLQTEFLAAERAAHAGQHGLWSPASRDATAALEQEKNQRHETLIKGLQVARGKKRVAEPPVGPDWLNAINEEAAGVSISRWLLRLRPETPGRLREQRLESERQQKEKEEKERKKREEERKEREEKERKAREDK
jgi:endonuclease YncB( thermonuclease family)